jgi:hypothetical protein
MNRLKLVSIIGGFVALLPALSAQLVNLSFDTSGTTGVEAKGVLSVYTDRVVVNYTEVTGTAGYITGFWFYNPKDENGVFIDFQQSVTIAGLGGKETNWDYSSPVPQFMSNVLDNRDAGDFHGAAMGQGSPNQWGLGAGDTPSSFTFFYNGSPDITPADLFAGNPTGPDMLFRWQSVGEDGEDSDKTTYVFVDFEIPPIEIIPEPSTVGLIAVAGLALIPMIRRIRRRDQK